MAGQVSRVMNGARAVLWVDGKKVGIFNQVSYGLTYNAQPVDIMGRYNPAEIAITHQEAITVTAQGWRIINAGPHAVAAVPRLQDLLNHADISLTITDRQNPKTPVLKVDGVRPTGYQTSINSRGLQELSVTFMGIVAEDESGGGAEADAVDLPRP